MNENTMIISTEEYKKLAKEALLCELLVAMIFDKAHIGYSGDLDFYDMDDEIRAFFPEKCKEALAKLKAEKARGEKDDV